MMPFSFSDVPSCNSLQNKNKRKKETGIITFTELLADEFELMKSIWV